MINFNSKLILILIVLQLSIITSCNRSQKKANNKNENNELKGDISISGAFALYPITVKWAEEFQKIHPDVRVYISAGGARKGMTDALSEMVDLGMFSSGITQSEKDKGAWWIAVSKDAVLPIVNANNPVLKDLKTKGLTKKMFFDIFISKKINTWGECVKNKSNKKINIYTRSDASGAAEMWGEYLGKNQKSLEGIGVFGAPGITDAIKKDHLGIGYNNMIYVYNIKTGKKYKGLEVIPIDLNENNKIDKDENFYDNLDKITKAIKNKIYPSPPTRNLYFISKGKPEKPVVIEFLKWILTKGQKYVKEVGYVQLSESKIQAEMQKLK